MQSDKSHGALQPDPKDRLILALDVDSLARATPLIEALSPYVGYFKVGLELITAVGGPAAVQHVQRLRGQVFYDAKFHDIPNTMGAASRSVAGIGAKLFTVHASAGLEALQAVASSKGPAKAYAVTILTSLGESTTQSLYGATPEQKVRELSELALKAGLDGVVCSPLELDALTQDPALKSLKKITPGIRPSWSPKGDQQRVMTPFEAIKKGADYIVVGRPITHPPIGVGSPIDAAKQILDEIRQALQ